MTHEEMKALDPDRLPRINPYTGRPFSIDEINAVHRAHAPSPQEAAQKQQRANDLSALKGAAEHLDRIRKFHAHNDVALRKAERDLSLAAAPFGGVSAAVSSGLVTA